VEGQQSKSGFTRMVLAMASAVVDPTVDYLKDALENVKASDLLQWCRDKLGVSVQSQIRRASASPKCGTDPG
jgi:predicted 3-demethylubiquinone-9 3-methyltransferase (glyoxalase superfamily)